MAFESISNLITTVGTTAVSVTVVFVVVMLFFSIVDRHPPASGKNRENQQADNNVNEIQDVYQRQTADNHGMNRSGLRYAGSARSSLDSTGSATIHPVILHVMPVNTLQLSLQS